MILIQKKELGHEYLIFSFPQLYQINILLCMEKNKNIRVFSLIFFFSWVGIKNKRKIANYLS